jgi:hypothetical protein
VAAVHIFLVQTLELHPVDQVVVVEGVKTSIQAQAVVAVLTKVVVEAAAAPVMQQAAQAAAAFTSCGS